MVYGQIMVPNLVPSQNQGTGSNRRVMSWPKGELTMVNLNKAWLVPESQGLGKVRLPWSNQSGQAPLISEQYVKIAIRVATKISFFGIIFFYFINWRLLLWLCGDLPQPTQLSFLAREYYILMHLLKYYFIWITQNYINCLSIS